MHKIRNSNALPKTVSGRYAILLYIWLINETNFNFSLQGKFIIYRWGIWGFHGNEEDGLWRRVLMW